MIQLPGDRVAIIPIKDPEKTKGGIYIPDMAKERTDQGIIKYVGPRVQSLKIGMYVIFSGYAGQAVYIEGEGSMIVVPEKFVFAELDNLPQQTIPGLYFMGRDGFTTIATYEQAMQLIAQAFQDAPWRNEYDERGRKMFDVRTPKPTPEEYNELTGI